MVYILFCPPTQPVMVMSVCVIVLVVMLTSCTILCLLSQKRDLQQALVEIQGELDKVRAAVEGPGKGNHPTGHKWINSNHTATITVPEDGLAGSSTLDSNTTERLYISPQPANLSGRIAHQDPVRLPQSCSHSQQHSPSTGERSWLGLEELVADHSPIGTAAKGSLCCSPQQRLSREEVGRGVV